MVHRALPLVSETDAPIPSELCQAGRQKEPVDTFCRSFSLASAQLVQPYSLNGYATPSHPVSSAIPKLSPPSSTHPNAIHQSHFHRPI